MTRLERERPGRVAVWLTILVCAGQVSCSSGPAPTAPAEPALLPALGSPVTPFVPLCGASPNFIAAPGELTRWSTFPVSLSINRVSLALAGEAQDTYEAAIREGLAVWAYVTGDAVGKFSVGLDVPGAPLEVRADPLDDDARASRSPARFDGQIRGRMMERGTVRLFPANMPGRSATLSTVVANVVAHEIGHALGILKHSPEPSDLMSASGNVDLVARPWVTPRDLNTLADAYCR